MIDEVTYEEIKAAKDDSMNSLQISEEFNISLEIVNEILGSINYTTYSTLDKKETKTIKRFGKEIIVSKDPSKNEKGYLRNKIEQNNPFKELSETESNLLFTIKGLWKMIDILQNRKIQIERDIRYSEEYLQSLITLAESYLEE